MWSQPGSRLVGRISSLPSRGVRSVSSTTDWVRRCVSDYSIEVTPNQAKKLAFAEVLLPRTVVNVTNLVGSNIEDTIATCRSLADAKMIPVAHVPARSFETLVGVEDYLAKLKDVGVQECLVLGGGAPQPAGELHCAMQILESGLLQKYGFARIGVAAHPEGHPDVGEEVMTETLLCKAEWAKANGVDMYYETQFCFTPGPIIEWESRTRALLAKRLQMDEDSPGLPAVHLGVAGPAKIANLIKFSLMAGVGNSIRFVTKYTGNVLKLATTQAPDELITGLAAHQRETPGCLLRTLHFYPFGGVAATARWANSVVDGNFQLGVDESSFKLS